MKCNYIYDSCTSNRITRILGGVNVSIRKMMIEFCYMKMRELGDEFVVGFEEVSTAELCSMYNRYKQNKRLGWVW
ncbi:hypothetical protein [Bacillus phage Tomato]|nr:hypothetical protein [Bacillus phage Tomato]